MSSLTDLFNPTLLIYLGVLVLVVALLVVYFESKMRDQNHKISSMLSLVSSMAEELNSVKFGLNTIMMSGGYNNNQNHLEENNNITNNNSLIAVSDNESDDGSDDDESIEDADLEDNTDDDLDDDELDNDLEDNSIASIKSLNNDVKVFKLNISQESKNDINDINEINFDDELDDDLEDELDDISITTSINEINNLEELENTHFLPIESIKKEKEKEKEKSPIEEIISLDYDDKINEDQFHNLKSINISSLEKEKENSNLDHIDYKKLALNKLRLIVVEKGLVSDASKMKKNELLKLLNIE